MRAPEKAAANTLLPLDRDVGLAVKHVMLNSACTETSVTLSEYILDRQNQSSQLILYDQRRSLIHTQVNIHTLYVVNTGQILFKHSSVLVCSCSLDSGNISCCKSKGTWKMSCKHPSSTWQRHRTLCGVTNILLCLYWNFFSSFTVKSSCTEVTMISIDLRPILWWTFYKLYALNIHQILS